MQNNQPTTSPLLISIEQEDIKKYYEVAGMDYQAWSNQLNMHFGYLHKWTDIFSLEKMLIQMSKIIIEKLQLNAYTAPKALDMGCGMGAVAREMVRLHPHTHVTGITIVDSQISYGNHLSKQENLQKKVIIMKNDYENTSFEANSFEVAYALESSCYANGTDKNALIAEMGRVLKAGGRFAIADGFLKTSEKMPYLLEKAYLRLCRCWALPCLANVADFEQSLQKNGFKNIKFEEISWKVAPSVAHIPRVTFKFLFQELWRNKSLRLAPERWDNIISPLLTMFLGLWRNHFGYFMVSGEKE